jgi:hypothetical protein
VRQWCPDGEAFQNAAGVTATEAAPVFDPSDDPPPPY